MIWLQTAVLLLAAPTGGDTVLLDFYTDGCLPCRQMAPTVDQLTSRGYPVQRINGGRDPATAARYGVTAFPTFVLVSGGRVVDGVVGMTSYDRLTQMFDKAASLRAQSPANDRPAAVPATMPSLDSPAVVLPAVASGPLSSRPVGSLVPVSLATSNPDTTSSRWTPRSPSAAAVEPSNALSTLTSGGAGPATNAQLIAATVRLRIEDPTGHSCGTGTIIDSRDGWALILTCGHLFRDSKGNGKIDVDLFGPDGPRRVAGELVAYDSEKRDLGLVRIRAPGRVCVAPVAPSGYEAAVGAPVASVGCNNGADPTVVRTRIRAKDKFVGPPNFQADGLPVEGRSGGGLFSAEGYVIGVCNAADPTDNAGLYAAIGSIQAELDRTQLAFVYQRPSRPSPNASSPGQWSPASGTSSADAPSQLVAVQPPAMPSAMPAPDALAEATGGPIPTSSRQTAPQDSTLTSDAGGLTPEEVAALEEIRRRKSEGAEVICIIRSPNDPTGKSEILRLDRASDAFMQQLAAESAGR